MPPYLDSLAPQETTIVHLLERRAELDPDGVFFSWADQTTTFGAFDAAVDRTAHRLLADGIGDGTHVAVLMDTSPDYLTLWFALAKIGAVEIPINTAYHGDVLRHQLVASAPTVCVTDPAYTARVRELGLPGLRHVVRGEAEFAALLAGPDAGRTGHAVRHDATTGIIFTSGTTGPSKGVLLSNCYLASYGVMYADINGLGPDDVILNFLPFFHVGAKFLTIATLVCGGRMRLQPRLSISTFIDEVNAHGVTNFVAVGGVCNMLLSKPARPDDVHSSIRTIYAVPDPADIHEEMERRFGCRMTTVYGSTEVGLPVFRGIDDDYRPGSCGRQSPYYDVMVVDEFDDEVPVGEAGELVVRPRRPFLVGSGYVGMPEKTVAAWRNLWLHSGDRARRDADGWFHFEDRATDSLRRRGENISSFEVESLVTGHPAVSEAIAVAAASEVGEDEVWVLVTLREGRTVSYDDLLDHCARTMPYFMVPRYLQVVEDFPRTPTAKVEKYKLRAAGPGPEAWDREAHGWRVTRDGLVRTVGADLLGSR
jgi:carnitine-CoA ligase